MNEPWRIVAAVAFLALLSGALIWAERDGASDESAPNTTVAIAGAAAGSTTVLPPHTVSTTVPTATSAFTTRPPVGVTHPPPPSEVTLADVLLAIDDAFAAWGEFAVTGDLDLVESTFDSAGPQYAQLREEASALSADPLGPPPYVFTVTNARLRRPDAARTAVVGDVALDRSGEPTQTFRWRVVMRWVGGDWLLWTVHDIDE